MAQHLLKLRTDMQKEMNTNSLHHQDRHHTFGHLLSLIIVVLHSFLIYFFYGNSLFTIYF